MLDCQTAQELIPALVLDVLDADEIVAVNEHLRRCAACHAEAEALRPLATDLALAAPTADAPSPRVKQRLMATAHESVHGRPVESASRPAGRWRQIVAGLAAGAAVAVIALLGASTLALESQVAQQQARLDRLTQQQAALRQFMLDAQLQPAAIAFEPGVNARAALYAADDRVAMAVAGLPTLVGEEVYQCWWVDADGAIPGTAFRVDENGAGVWVWKRPEEAGYDKMIISKEAHAGQQQMQGKPILTVKF